MNQLSDRVWPPPRPLSTAIGWEIKANSQVDRGVMQEQQEAFSLHEQSINTALTRTNVIGSDGMRLSLELIQAGTQQGNWASNRRYSGWRFKGNELKQWDLKKHRDLSGSQHKQAWFKLSSANGGRARPWQDHRAAPAQLRGAEKLQETCHRGKGEHADMCWFQLLKEALSLKTNLENIKRHVSDPCHNSTQHVPTW